MKEFNQFLYGENGTQNAATVMRQERMKDSAKSSLD
jgi:hypothetical protein